MNSSHNSKIRCRHCLSQLDNYLVDLGVAPPSNSYLKREELLEPEQSFPLKVMICEMCWLAQTVDFRGRHDLFTEDYAYFSSSSKSWLIHAKCYFDSIVQRLGLNCDSFVVELASNDGYLLKNFVEAGIPCLGVEPTSAAARVAKSGGVNTIEDFFGSNLGKKLTEEGKSADLVIGNNVLAHVPDINDFLLGTKALLKSGGCVTFEFPSLINLLKFNQFDTIYHEHFSYISLTAASNIMSTNGLKIFDIEEIDTHGGSIRIYVCHKEEAWEISDRVSDYLHSERAFGLTNVETYGRFQAITESMKIEALAFLCAAKARGNNICAYGAAAKGSTFLNFAGIKSDLISMVADVAPLKVGKYLPGSHIPIVSPETMINTKPDYVIILPWNLKDEIVEVLAPLRVNGTKFATFVPSLSVF